MAPYYVEDLSAVSNKSNNKDKDKLRKVHEDTYKYLLLSVTVDTEVGIVAFQIVCG